MLIGNELQVLLYFFHKFFSPFLHSTSSLSVSQEYLALADGAAEFRGDFTGPHLLRILRVLFHILLRGYHTLWPDFPLRSDLKIILNAVL